MHTFKTVSDIRIAPGGAAKLDLFVEGLSANKRIAIVTDKGVRGLGLMDAGVDALKAAGFDVLVLDQVVADPPDTIVLDIADAIRAFNAGLVIGFGGGSPMDTAKVAACLAGSEQLLETMYGVDQVKGPRLPLLLIPTTSGTGSEVTNVAILTTGKTAKKGVVSDPLYADRVLLDAELTLGLPASITASTGIDAMVHAIEAYTSIRLKNPISDALALTALRKLRNNIVQAVNEPGNIDARNEMLMGAMIAGQAFSNAPCAAVHALAYPLGGFFHVPHGLSNALVLTEVMKYNQPEADHWYGEIASDLGVGQSGTSLVDEMLRIKDATHVPQTLTEVNIPSDAIKMMADDAMTKDRLLMNNAREMTHEAVVKIYETIL